MAASSVVAERARRAMVRAVRSARPGASVDESWSIVDLTAQTVRWAAAGLRGTVVFGFIPGRTPRFAERGVSVVGRRHCQIGRWSVIERGVLLRCYGGEGIVLGDRVVIGSGSILEVTSGLARDAGHIRIGTRSSLGDYCYIGGAGGVELGKDVLCGQYVSFHSENHLFTDPHVPIREQGVQNAGIRVDDDCWIGAGVRVLDGVVIGRGAVVGAGSVVTRSVEPYTIVAGAPARVIGFRSAQGTGTNQGMVPPSS